MAITRAQQAKQMLREGGRTELKKGGRQDPMGGREDFTAAEIRAADPIGFGGGLTGPSFQGGGGDDRPPPEKPKPPKITVTDRFVPPTLRGLDYVGKKLKDSRLGRFLNTIQREKYLEQIKEEDEKLYQETVDDLAKLGYAERDVELFGPKDKYAGRDIEKFSDLYEDQAKSILNTVRDSKDGSVGTLYDDYLDEITNRFNPDNKDGPDDPCKGPNPPAYCFVGIRSASAVTPETEEEEDVGLYRRFRANGGRIGFFKGAQADASAGKGAMSPGTDTSGGFRGGDDGPKGPSDGGGGGGKGPVIKEKPPVNIVKEKSNVQKIMDIFGLGSDNNPEDVSLGTGLAEKAKKDIITNKEEKQSGLSEAEQALREQGLLAIGGRVGLMEGGMPYEGGIMDLESARQMYSLGKLVKKVTRGVKKIAKSPIGKAAIIAAGGYYLGGGNLFGLQRAGMTGFKFANIPGFIGAKNFIMGSPIGTKTAGDAVARSGGLLDLIGGKVGATILGTSVVAGLLSPKQEEEAQRISDETGIDIEVIRANPDQFLARRFKAEGGSMKEPVATKTLPLLDMGGKEMDLRAEGGFVPIGRMEKADDVPARLSKNEFVFTADAVRNAGEGDVDKGAEVMYNMMKNLEAGGEVSEESQGLEGARRMIQTSQRLEEVL